ncbi:MAG: CheR family methyltransferase [Bacillota bacterium]
MKQDINVQNMKNEDVEIKLLLEAIYLKYGYDFKGYSQAHIKRRVLRRRHLSGFESVMKMVEKVLDDKDFLYTVIADFSINVTEMFRDPDFYKDFRAHVVPILKTYPYLRIWHAGCSTGEEVYSMAILLEEENLYDKSQIYATDFNINVLKRAKEGIYSIDAIKEYTYNYQNAGGIASFADYYIAKYDSVIIDQSLKKRIIFADHNLVTDGVFGEMNVIVCRNVLIYFSRDLQSKVVRLFHSSLSNGGFLCLGTMESLKYTGYVECFDVFSEKQKIYRKMVEAKK